MVNLLDFRFQSRDIPGVHPFRNIHGKASHAELIQQNILTNHGFNVFGQIS